MPYLRAALHSLRISGHLPRPGEGPPWIGSHLADEVAHTERDALAAAIRDSYPARFGIPHAAARRYAEKYPPALLRAVIASCVVSGEEITADGETAGRRVDELIALLEADRGSWRLVQFVADIDATDVHSATIHGVAVHDATDWARVLSSQLPEAGQLLDEEFAEVWGVAATAMLVLDDPRDIPEMNYIGPEYDRIGRVLSAIRLATGATIDMTAACQGEPVMIHQDPPIVRPQEWSTLGQWFRRPLELTPPLVGGIDQLAAVIENDDSEPLAIALGRYARSHRPAHWQDRVVDLAVALEAALIGGDSSEEITLRVSTRAAHLLATDDDSAEGIFDDVADLYALRSQVVHGGTRAERIWRRFTDRHDFAETLAFDRLAPAFDRLRDVVRRAILVRLVLRADTLGGRLWPDRDIKVDRVLVGQTDRDRWRAEVRGRCASLGIPDAWKAASPLRDLMAERRMRTRP